jgi:hypothetical protein
MKLMDHSSLRNAAWLENPRTQRRSPFPTDVPRTKRTCFKSREPARQLRTSPTQKEIPRGWIERDTVLRK